MEEVRDRRVPYDFTSMRDLKKQHRWMSRKSQKQSRKHRQQAGGCLRGQGRGMGEMGGGD